MVKEYTPEDLRTMENPYEKLLKDIDSLNASRESFDRLNQNEQDALIHKMFSLCSDTDELPKSYSFASHSSPFFTSLSEALELVERIRSIPARGHEAITENGDLFIQFERLANTLLNRQQEKCLDAIVKSSPDRRAMSALRPLFDSCFKSSEDALVDGKLSFFNALKNKLENRALEAKSIFTSPSVADKEAADKVTEPGISS